MNTEFDDEGDNDADSAPMRVNELTQVKPEPRFVLEVPRPVELVPQFIDSSYWRPQQVTDDDLDALLAEYE